MKLLVRPQDCTNERIYFLAADIGRKLVAAGLLQGFQNTGNRRFQRGEIVAAFEQRTRSYRRNRFPLVAASRATSCENPSSVTFIPANGSLAMRIKSGRY